MSFNEVLKMLVKCFVKFKAMNANAIFSLFLILVLCSCRIFKSTLIKKNWKLFQSETMRLFAVSVTCLRFMILFCLTT